MIKSKQSEFWVYNSGLGHCARYGRLGDFSSEHAGFGEAAVAGSKGETTLHNYEAEAGRLVELATQQIEQRTAGKDQGQLVASGRSLHCQPQYPRN